ncbi:MAG: response regulator [Spirochaetales bacterium]|nr:MAG: response regulator [Spirochaetales bacterium]
MIDGTMERKIRILIVEDEIITAKNLEYKLSYQDYEVVGIVSSGEEALEAARKHRPDLILMDISLKGSMDGITTASRIKMELDVPVIYMTAYVDDSTINRARLTAPFGYIVKPFQIRELRSNIEMAMYKHGLEAKLKESEARHRMISELISDFVFLVRFTKKGEPELEWITGAYQRITGYSLEEAESLGHKWLSIVRSEDLPSLKDMRKMFRETSSLPVVYECRITTKNGELRYLKNYLKPEWNPAGGRLVKIIGAAQDVTEQRLAELEKEKQHTQLIQADKLASLGILVAGVAHEINNPNQTILMTGQFLREAWQGILPILDRHFEENGDFLLGGAEYSDIRTDLQSHFSWIEDCAKRINSIVKDLREYALPDAGAPMTLVNINMVLRSAVTLVSNMVKHATTRFAVEYAKDLPMVNGSFQKLEQVIINLIQNSCQALRSKDEGIFVATSFDPVSKSVLITVRDEGLGIPKHELPHVKDPFFTTKRTTGGTGLGLSVSNTIIQDHGGKLEFTSDSNSGTTSVIMLPVPP